MPIRIPVIGRRHRDIEKKRNPYAKGRNPDSNSWKKGIEIFKK